MRRTRSVCSASTAHATARYVLPVPAGPMPNVRSRRVDVREVLALIRAAAANAAALRVDRHFVRGARHHDRRGLHVRFLHGEVHAIGRQRLARRQLEQVPQHVLGRHRRLRRPGDLDPAAATAHLHVEPLLDVPQVLVHRADEVREPARCRRARTRDRALRWMRSCNGCAAAATRRPLRHCACSVITTSAKLVDQRLRAVEVHPAHVLGAARQLLRVLLRRTLDQHALHRADHARG